MINEFIDKYMAVDFVDHSSQVQGRENAKQGYAAMLSLVLWSFKKIPEN
jgi:hypothetical protein